MTEEPADSDSIGVEVPPEPGHICAGIAGEPQGKSGPAQDAHRSCPSGGSLSPCPGNGAPLRLSFTRQEALSLREQLADALEDPRLDEVDVSRKRVASLLVALDTELRGWLEA